MRLILEGLLGAAEASQWCERLLAADNAWEPGQRTAGWHARAVKHNRQLAEEAPLVASPSAGERWLLINSLGCRPLLRLDGHPLTAWPEATAEAERLWRRLL
jgi:hypothetical protein